MFKIYTNLDPFIYGYTFFFNYVTIFFKSETSCNIICAVFV